MKHLLLVSLLCVSAGVASAKPAKKIAAKVAPVAWRTDFDGAMKEARRAHKPVFVDFYTDWCGACKYLDQTTYRDPKFVRASRDWVMVKVNAEKGARNIQIAKQYQLEGYPTLLMLDRRGKKLNQVAGAYPTGMMLSEMKKAQTASGVSMVRNAARRPRV